MSFITFLGFFLPLWKYWKNFGYPPPHIVDLLQRIVILDLCMDVGYPPHRWSSPEGLPESIDRFQWLIHKPMMSKNNLNNESNSHNSLPDTFLLDPPLPPPFSSHPSSVCPLCFSLFAAVPFHFPTYLICLDANPTKSEIDLTPKLNFSRGDVRQILVPDDYWRSLNAPKGIVFHFYSE